MGQWAWSPDSYRGGQKARSQQPAASSQEPATTLNFQLSTLNFNPVNLWQLIVKMLTSGSNISSKRGAGLFLVVVYGYLVTVMAIHGDYSLVKATGYLAGALLGLGLLDKLGKSK